jgi:dTDP-glucose pyrophosphorylase
MVPSPGPGRAPSPDSGQRVSRAIVLARGLGTRMRAADPDAPLTPDQQRAADAGLKAMMPVNGRPFLDFVLGSLADAGITDIALIVAPDHEMLRRYYLDESPPSRVRLGFVVQAEARGTADAVLSAAAWTNGGEFLAVNADNLYPARVLSDLAVLGEPGLPAFDAANLVRTGNIPAERVRAFASIELDQRGYLVRIVEKPPGGITPDREGVLVSMNCWRFDARIFAACRDVPRSARGEFELPEAVGLAMSRGVRFKAFLARGPVLDLSRRADLADVGRRLSGLHPRP